jgi:hypothetical protein
MRTATADLPALLPPCRGGSAFFLNLEQTQDEQVPLLLRVLDLQCGSLPLPSQRIQSQGGGTKSYMYHGSTIHSLYETGRAFFLFHCNICLNNSISLKLPGAYMRDLEVDKGPGAPFTEKQ